MCPLCGVGQGLEGSAAKDKVWLLTLVDAHLLVDHTPKQLQGFCAEWVVLARPGKVTN